jgi:hypothetical protein
MGIDSIMLQGKRNILKGEKTMTCGTLQRWYQRQAEACKFEYIFYNMEHKQVLLCSILKDMCVWDPGLTVLWIPTRIPLIYKRPKRDSIYMV